MDSFPPASSGKDLTSTAGGARQKAYLSTHTRVKEEEAATFLSPVVAKLPVLLSCLLNQQKNPHCFSIYLNPFLRQATQASLPLLEQRKKNNTKQ